jgi:hypothetical protein
LLVNRIEHLHHGTLDDFIFQRSNPKRPFSPILFLNELTPRGQRPIGAAMNASMQIHKLGFQVLPILAPRGAIHSWSRISLELEIRRSQQIDRHVMK